MKKEALIPHLFRTEFTKLVSVLCKAYGLYNIQIAEDLVSDTFLKAAETWGLKGVPDHPQAWLYRVAKNKANDYFRRNLLFHTKIRPILLDDSQIHSESDLDLSEANIHDSQLQMLFAVCDPALSVEAQITFALRVLCGFGITEIAGALLSNKATINKRLLRTKKAYRKGRITLQVPEGEVLKERMGRVLLILYLLFNEGYYSSSSEQTIQREMCLEAMRLLYLLLDYPLTNQPESQALMALFCFQSSRFDARENERGSMVLYEDQNDEKWNRELIDRGEYYLMQASKEKVESKYHLEALIAFWHTRKHADEKEKWNGILQLYNRLLQWEYSPVVALNRTYALAKVKGYKTALKEALKINMKDHHLYHALLAELYRPSDTVKQVEHLREALKLARTSNERNILLKKLTITKG